MDRNTCLPIYHAPHQASFLNDPMTSSLSDLQKQLPYFMSYSDTGTVIATRRAELPVADQFFKASVFKTRGGTEVYKINTHIKVLA